MAMVMKLVAAAAGALAGGAVARELSKPPQERTWHGEIARVPYDFRPPTVEKVRKTLWDPENPRVFVPHAFGVGWSVNFARLAELAEPPPGAERKEITDAPASS